MRVREALYFILNAPSPTTPVLHTAGCDDWLKTIDFKVEVGEPVLWALSSS